MRKLKINLWQYNKDILEEKEKNDIHIHKHTYFHIESCHWKFLNFTMGGNFLMTFRSQNSILECLIFHTNMSKIQHF